MKTDRERFPHLLSRCSLIWRSQLDERLRPWGITSTSWRILSVLTASGQRYHQTALARQVGIETPTLVGLLDRLEMMQWVRREPDPNDRRVKVIEATAEGKALCRKLRTQVEAVREQMLGALSADEVEAGVRLLEKIVQAAEAG
jgi:MarR family transcriptional regulator, transcriptional regulator for hemolysin